MSAESGPDSKHMIKVLVVDDSPVVAQLLTHVLNSDCRMRVVGVVSNGEEAVEAAKKVQPDVITMDIHMPKMDGFEATRRIMESCPVPIVIVSGSLATNEVATNFRAIEAGALAVAQQPKGIGHPHFEAMANQLLQTVRLMSEVKVVRRWPRSRYAAGLPAASHVLSNRSPGTVRAVVMGASTGGPLVLQTILAGLPKDFSVPILIVQHMTPGFVYGFVEWLERSSGFPIKVASPGESIEPGRAYVAPDTLHMGIRSDDCIHLSSDPPENGMRPAVSYLFRSAAEAFGSKVIGVLLSGMGKDGVDELKVLKDMGAVTLVQDKESSVVFGMPGQAMEIGAATHTLPPEAICRMLASLVKKT